MATLFPSDPTASVTLNLSGSADVNNAIKEAGLSFGKLLETTGLAIADSQRRLNDVGAASTSALAAQQVDVIAAQVNAYDDDGNLDATGTKTISQNLPLINFIDPVFYEWAQVRLQGQFYASEFIGSSEASSSSLAATASVSDSGGGFLFGKRTNTFTLGVRTNASDIDTSNEQAFGHIRASALLQPKTDIGVPKPRQLLDAPSLGVRVGPDVDDTTVPGTRLKKVSILWFKRNGEQQGSGVAAPSIEVSGALWAFDPTPPSAAGKTNDQGEVEIVIKRVLPVIAGQPDPDRTPVDVTVTARLGVVSTTTVVRF